MRYQVAIYEHATHHYVGTLQTPKGRIRTFSRKDLAARLIQAQPVTWAYEICEHHAAPKRPRGRPAKPLVYFLRTIRRGSLKGRHAVVESSSTLQPARGERTIRYARKSRARALAIFDRFNEGLL
jgi:hypothetical protein